MVPQFNGGAYSPVTPNNGNPNTVYNTAPTNEQEVRYMPAFEQPLGGGQVMQPNYGMLQPSQVVKPEFGERFAGPVMVEASGTAMPQSATPMPKPRLGGTVAPSFAKPRVPEGGAVVPNIKPRFPEPPQATTTANTVPLFANQYARSPLAITMEQPEQPSGRLDRNTMYTDALNGMLSRMQSLETTLQPIPIPGMLPSQPQPGGTTPTGPTNPAQPERPRLPGLGTTIPDEDGIIRGPDPIDYGRIGGGSVGRLLGLSSSLGMSGPQIASAYNNMPAAQRAQLDADTEELNNPDTPEDEKPGILARIRQGLGQFLGAVVDAGRAIDDLGDRIDSRMNRALDSAINYLTADPTRMRSVEGGRAEVGQIQQDKGPTGSATGGRGKPTDPSAQKPGSRIPRKPT